LLRALLGSTDPEGGKAARIDESIAPCEDHECNNRADDAYDYQCCQVCKLDVAALECALRLECGEIETFFSHSQLLLRSDTTHAT